MLVYFIKLKPLKYYSCLVVTFECETCALFRLNLLYEWESELGRSMNKKETSKIGNNVVVVVVVVLQ